MRSPQGRRHHPSMGVLAAIVREREDEGVGNVFPREETSNAGHGRASAGGQGSEGLEQLQKATKILFPKTMYWDLH